MTAIEIRPPEQRARFKILAEWWHIDTVDMASPREKFQHPAYQRIIAMGQPVVPFILENLRENGGYWFEALRIITGESPVRPEDRNNYEAVRRAWLEWGMSRRLSLAHVPAGGGAGPCP